MGVVLGHVHVCVFVGESKCTCFNLQSVNTTSAKTKVTVSPNMVAYSLKVMNPARKSDYCVHKFCAQRFPTVSSARKHISNFLISAVTTFGYIIPGHGLKGKQQVIKEDEDLKTMYAVHFGKREIMLWCPGELKEKEKEQMGHRKRGREEDENDCTVETDMPKSKTGKRMQEVNNIVEKLRDKHKSSYSVEKLHAWAHMIHMGKHASYENPPDLPYFGKKRETSKPSTKPSTHHEMPAAISISPGKRIHYRSECMDQLSKWHSLLERGVISEEKYSSLQASILEDITKL